MPAASRSSRRGSAKPPTRSVRPRTPTEWRTRSSAPVVWRARRSRSRSGTLERGQQGAQQGQQDGPNGQDGQQGQGQGQQQGQQGSQGQGGADGAQGGQQADGRNNGDGGAFGGGNQINRGGAYGRGWEWGRNFQLTPEDIRQLRGEARQWTGEAMDLRRDLTAENIDPRELDEIIRALRQLDDPRVYQNANELTRLQSVISEGLKRFEFGLRRRADLTENSVVLSGSDEVPEDFRNLVEQYFKSLSKGAAR